MAAPLTILQVLPALDAGGVERTTIEIAQAVAAAGGTALVACAGGRLEGELSAAGGELIRLPLAAKNPATVWANAGRLAALARMRGVRLIHARSRAPAWSALWAARRVKLPFVTTYHGIYNAGSAAKRLYNSVMARGDVVIANSEFTRAHVLAEHGVSPERVVTIARAVDLDRFDPGAVAPARVAALRTQWAGAADFVVLLPARLTRWKGGHVLVAAAALLKARGLALSFVFAGDAQSRDGYRAALEAAAREGGADVRIAGHVDDMPAALLAADVVVAPNIEPEAFGRSVVEAQAMGRPVIVSNSGAYAETVVHGETGWRITPDDANALANAIECVFTKNIVDRKAIGDAAQSRARTLYAKEALQASTLQVYRRLLGELD
jgi:glycosyltransferase involved in cell wall biosynthesis